MSATMMEDVVPFARDDARFSRSAKHGWEVRVKSEEDLTGRKVQLERRDGERSTVRLTERVFPARDGKPALYKFEDADRPRRPVDMTDGELAVELEDVPREWENMTKRQKAAARELIKRKMVAA